MNYTQHFVDSRPNLCIIICAMDKITKDMHVDEIIAKYPSLSKTFIEFGLPCLVCGEPFWGTIEELSRQHNVNAEKLVEKLNQERREINAKS